MRLLAAALVLGSAHAALAGDDLESVDRSPRLEGAFGLRVGSFHVGSFDGMGVGFHLDAGRRYDRLQLLGEYSYMSLSPSTSGMENGVAAMGAPISDQPTGFVNRFGADVRYSVGRIAGGDQLGIRGDFWLEAGVGAQLIRWDLGGELTRGDVSFGFGGQVTLRFGERHDKHLGLFYAFKSTFARAPASYANLPPTCAGPCDTATRPVAIDRSFLFNLGLLFGD